MNYTRFYGEWEDSNGTQKWRYDGKCSSNYPLPDGTPAECNPNGEYPCCSLLLGRCGNTTNYCDCSNCMNYTRFYGEWEDSNGTQKWRYDGKCSSNYPLPDGTPAECNPNGEYPCCSLLLGRCGNTTNYCDCSNCMNYTRFYGEWEDSNGTQKWRYDAKCGSNYPLPDGTPAQCDPREDKPCCSTSNDNGVCHNTAQNCLCRDCVNYMVLKRLRDSKSNCTVTKIHGFLKNVCYTENKKHFVYGCIYSKYHYTINYVNELYSVSKVCDNDPHFYQVCGLWI